MARVLSLDYTIAVDCVVCFQLCNPPAFCSLVNSTLVDMMTELLLYLSIHDLFPTSDPLIEPKNFNEHFDNILMIPI